jgi:MFS superfamily sulfate permease-like transporter
LSVKAKSSLLGALLLIVSWRYIQWSQQKGHESKLFNIILISTVGDVVVFHSIFDMFRFF